MTRSKRVTNVKAGDVAPRPKEGEKSIRIHVDGPGCSELTNAVVMVPVWVPVIVPACRDIEIRWDDTDQRITSAFNASANVTDFDARRIDQEPSVPTPGNHDVLREQGIALQDE